jgi:hypothetical protein
MMMKLTIIITLVISDILFRTMCVGMDIQPVVHGINVLDVLKEPAERSPVEEKDTLELLRSM